MSKSQTKTPAKKPGPATFSAQQAGLIEGRLDRPVSEIYAVSTMLEMLDAYHDNGTVQTVVSHAVRVLINVAEALQTEVIPSYENLGGDPLISTYAAAAAHWGLPVWAMLVPGTTQDMFEDLTKMMRVVKLMRDYLDCSDTQRNSIEGMAAGLAELNRICGGG